MERSTVAASPAAVTVGEAVGNREEATQKPLMLSWLRHAASAEDPRGVAGEEGAEEEGVEAGRGGGGGGGETVSLGTAARRRASLSRAR